VVDEADEVLPPVGATDSKVNDADLPDWARDDDQGASTKSGTIIRHSANWTDATIPQLR
jgi:hypothetical protein